MYDPLADIRQYGRTMTISQVVRFFEKKELPITRAMVQNYIRGGLLPPPAGKRHYTHKHLAALVLINYLKSVFDMEDIKNALTPLMDGEGLPLETYESLLTRLDELSGVWKRTMSAFFFDAEALSRVLLMTHTADLKQLGRERLP